MTKQLSTSADIQAMHQELGIPESYAASCGLEFQPECLLLVTTEMDVFGRQPYLEQTAYSYWQQMQESALKEGVILQIVSAYRSAQYQKDLLQKKLAAGQHIDDILKVNAAPGYSEHHSGCALDISSPDFEPLEEEFENSPAFAWLCQHAKDFGFTLSFPRDNPSGVCYEPWHWKYTAK
jgi:zinc D-Ala-D-Ala carboxypeptidase